jgi:hypothetical protein
MDVTAPTGPNLCRIRLTTGPPAAAGARYAPGMSLSLLKKGEAGDGA